MTEPPHAGSETSDDRYRLAFQRAPVGIALVAAGPGRRLTIVEANPELERMLGRSGGELVGRDPRTFLVLDPVLRSEFRRVAMGEVASHQAEARYTPASGQPRWAILAYAAHPAPPDGAPRLMVAHVRDIDDRVRAAEELRASRRQLEEAELLAGTGSFERWSDDERVQWTAGLYRLLGYQPGSVEPSFERVREHVHPDDRPILDRHAREQALESRSFELRLVRTDGKEIVVAVVRTPILDDSGRAVGARGAIRDITAQRRLEQAFLEAEHFRAMFETNPVATFVVDLDDGPWRIGRANVAAAELTEVAVEVAMGRPLASLFPDGRLPDPVREVLEGAATVHEGVHEITHAGGDPISVDMAVYRTTVGPGATPFGVVHARPSLQRPAEPAAPSAAPPLSDREVDVLRLVAEGLGGAEIAARLHLSPETVKTHLRRVYLKLGVSDRAAAVAQGFRLGMLH